MYENKLWDTIKNNTKANQNVSNSESLDQITPIININKDNKVKGQAKSNLNNVQQKLNNSNISFDKESIQDISISSERKYKINLDIDKIKEIIDKMKESVQSLITFESTTDINNNET